LSRRRDHAARDAQAPGPDAEGAAGQGAQEPLQEARQHPAVGTMSSAKPCPFCAIAAGESQAHVVFEDADAIAFLDRAPLFAGHVLLIPRTHIETIYEA